MAALLKRIGITQSDLLVEVQRDQLVAGYVGQTAPKTQEKIDEACAGVLFVDEAYRLSPCCVEIKLSRRVSATAES